MIKIVNIALLLALIAPPCRAQRDTAAQYREAVNYVSAHTKEIQHEWAKIFDRHERRSMERFRDRSFCISRMVCYKDIVEFSPQAIDSGHTKIKVDPALFNKFRLIDPTLYGKAYSYKSFLSPVLDSGL